MTAAGGAAEDGPGAPLATTHGPAAEVLYERAQCDVDMGNAAKVINGDLGGDAKKATEALAPTKVKSGSSPMRRRRIRIHVKISRNLAGPMYQL